MSDTPASSRSGAKAFTALFLAAQVLVLIWALADRWNPPTATSKMADAVAEASATNAAVKQAAAALPAASDEKMTKTDAGSPAASEGKKTKANAALQTQPSENAVLIIVMIAGGLGGAMHALNSFVGYLGNKSFEPAWIPWYLCRAPIGAGLATAVYFAVRAGLMTSSVSSNDLNYFGFAAVSLLTGLFNRNATAKLLKVSEAIFTPAGQESNPITATIALTKIDPAIVQTPVTAPQEVNVTGSGFSSDVAVRVDGTALASSDVKFVSESNLKITLSVAVLSVKGTKKIQVVRTGAKAATSNTMGLEVT